MTTTLNNNIKEAVFLVGPPAAGKSTTRFELYPNYLVIDPDELKKELPGYDPKNPSKVHLQSKILSRKLFEEYLSSDQSFVYDTTGGNEERMIKEIREAREKGFKIILLQVTCSLEVCLERNRLRERTVPDEVVESIWYEVQETSENLIPHADEHIKVDNS
ncbi:AAA family ATPase [Shimazuella kribbensis]|uniref:AAA family ATPase n=1 Tax=Shimazuella kribbensis TaxID=139808 RepID=UPI00041CC911|nr:AAA family ATPase [Shimazuella kribbensis]